MRTPLVLLDANGCVIGPADAEYTAGECLPTWQVGRGAPVQVDGQTVGTVIQTGAMPLRDPDEEDFLNRMGRGLLFAAIGAGIVALLLGLALSRTLTRPLRRLTAAIHAMAAGNLEQSVDITSHDEIGELAGAFNSMSTQLAQSNQARRQMTADIAHELRNPLMVMTGYIEALREGVLRPTPERFDMMYEEAQHLQRLVADLRTLSLADAGELALSPQIVDSATLLARVAEAYAPNARKAGIVLAVQPAAAMPAVKVDVERMVQVLANLVTNALRYTPAGGTICLGAHVEGDGVALTVTDTGEGIAPDVLPRVFDRFYQADTSRSQNGEESGLGLAIVKSIVTSHGGAITVSSKLGQGSTFAIHLPTASAV
jgi:signal transduction histidine kinase